MKNAIDAKVFRWSLSRAAEDPEASTETWGYLLPPDPRPRLQDLKAAESEIPSDERKWLVLSPEGTWHHSQSHRLWIPPSWREAICRKSLQTPVALQTISLDFVGPRQIGRIHWWYAVIIDHCTRFVCTHAQTHKPTTQDAKDLLQLSWIPIFGAPDVLIVDKDSIFSQEFKAWTRAEMGVQVGQTSPGYPQGNGINESSHRTLEKSIAIQVQRGLGVPFPTLLSEATLAHNAAPNVSIGSSPFCQVFGEEPCLPGLQNLFQLWRSKMLSLFIQPER
eukprot:GHVS01101565.1.p1 GENE.GHVS01101565.1~~GHVS01101565.1.p1  ORF type:complete len:277 (-),score=18.54 GHVS01101565.1:548-1378(-)